MIIDFHTHAFPDKIAEKAMATLEAKGDIDAFHNGTISSLLNSMDQSGIDKAVLCSIATRPDQFEPILNWSKKIYSDRIIPLPSIHPDSDDLKEKVKIISNEGFKGIKVHPYYQGFKIDDRRMFYLYEEIIKHNLFIVSHCGYDIAFPREDIASPARIHNVLNKFSELKFITTHFGGWEIWEEVEEYILGKKIYMEISFSLELMGDEMAEKFLKNHPSEYILFGTDSPWTSQIESLKKIRTFDLENTLLDKILYKNAETLLS